MSGGHLRGLTVFISDLRNCTSKEQEAKRVEKEMAHIRQKFTADAHMNGYNRKKYVWKILYMYMLGYEVDFGHMEAVNLISSPKYSEKSVGYAWCALMLREGDELLRLIINSIRTDLISKQDNAVCLVRSAPPMPLPCSRHAGDREADGSGGGARMISCVGVRPAFRKREAAQARGAREGEGAGLGWGARGGWGLPASSPLESRRARLRL